MSTLVDKNVHISTERARRLEQLACKLATTEDVLIEQGLDLLFMKQDCPSESEADVEDDWQLLARLETENGPVPYNTRPIHKIDRDQIVSIVGAALDLSRIRRIDE